VTRSGTPHDQYWSLRLDSVPVQLTSEEASALAGWAIGLEDSMDESVDLALRSPAGLQQHGQVLLEIRNRADHSPASCARLLGHLLAGTATPFWRCDLVHEIIVKVRDVAPEDSLRRIREESLRLGCIPAAEV